MKNTYKAAVILCLILAVTSFVACKEKVQSLEGVLQEISREEDVRAVQTDEETKENGEKPTETIGEEREVEKEDKKAVAVSQNEKEETEITYLVSNADGLNVRKGAGVGYPSLGTLDKGDAVLLLGEEGDFYKTKYYGTDAFVAKKYVEKFAIKKADEKIEKVIEKGCEVLGTPYVYGATRLHNGFGKINKGFSDKEFDCSSLMQYIFYYGANIYLQVNTRTQVFQGESVKKEEVKRGDLLFLTNDSRKDKKGTERVGHVALYLGNNYILHTASDHAVIEQMTAKRWAYFICARRVI